MKKTATITIAAAALLAAGCTAQQRQLAAELAESPATTPAVSVNADCEGFEVTIPGQPDGTNVFVAIGAQPPYGYTQGGYSFQFTVAADGSHHGVLLVDLYQKAHGYPWNVDIGSERVAEGDVVCK